MQYFKKIKINTKFHEELSIKNLNKDQVSYSAMQRHVGAWGKRDADPLLED